MLAAVKLTALEVKSKVEVFPNGHIQIKGRLLGQISYQLFGADGIAENINACNASLARRRRKISRKDIHCGTFACTVGAQKTYDFAFSHLKADVVYRAGGAVIFYKMLNFYHERVQSFLTHSGEKTLPYL